MYEKSFYFILRIQFLNFLKQGAKPKVSRCVQNSENLALLSRSGFKETNWTESLQTKILFQK